MKRKKGGSDNTIIIVAVLAGAFLFRKQISGVFKKVTHSAVARAYDSDSQYKWLSNNPYYMGYGPYPRLNGSANTYVENWSPK